MLLYTLRTRCGQLWLAAAENAALDDGTQADASAPRQTRALAPRLRSALATRQTRASATRLTRASASRLTHDALTTNHAWRRVLVHWLQAPPACHCSW
eukprot:358262-Chlamydomonas_euryale.AAC.9